MCTLTFGCLEEPRWAFTHAAMHFPLIPTMISWRLSREPQPQTAKEMPEVFRYILFPPPMYSRTTTVIFFRLNSPEKESKV